MYIFKSTLRDIYTELKNKIALSFFDDKRYIILGDPQSLAWGHKNITENENSENLLASLINVAEDMVDDDDEDVIQESFFIENFNFSLFN